MQEKDYQLLIESCDQILCEQPTRLETVSISALHVLNEHPSNLEKYVNLFNSSSNRLGNRLKKASIQLKCLLRLFKSENTPAKEIEQKDAVFISHLLNEQLINSTEDFYFGDIRNDFDSSGRTSLMVLINHTKKDSSKINEELKNTFPSRLILSKYLSFGKELRILKRMQIESARIKRLAREKKGFERKFYDYIAEQAISASSFTPFRIYEQLVEIFRIACPKVVITTFEGHAFERLVFAAARNVDPNVYCVGYHHTLIFPKQHAIKRAIRSDFDPDLVLTAGEITASYLMSSSTKHKWHVRPIGIHRRQALGMEPTAEIFARKRNCCLVAPDGIISEISFMFNFALDAAQENPDTIFILRLHPLVSPKNLIAEFPRFGSLPANVVFSTETLTNDFQQSKWILYRASSTAIYAVLDGLRPIYIEKENEMCVDSLFGLKYWKKKVYQPAGLKAHFDSDLSTPISTLLSELTPAFGFCNRYFIPLKKDEFLETLNMKGLSSR